ncbi:MAG TPA: hypothetical protein VJC07_02930 [Candidatus Nanoarchaeia archaeon]|nr:hypothetical protein [Candidatus Nanoarchaeia archaeon]
MATNLPIKKFRSGNIEAAIWLNKHKRNENEEIEFKSVSLSRSYKKKDENQWRNEVINLRKMDIAKALLVLQKAQEELLLFHENNEEGD